MECDIELLITEVQQRPAIWDKTLASYHDRIAKSKAWQEVFIFFKEDYETMPSNEKKNYEKDITTKWKTVRDGFRKSLERQKRAKRSGASALKMKKYVFNDQLSFLKKQFEERPTEDSLRNDSEIRHTEESEGDMDSESEQQPISRASKMVQQSISNNVETATSTHTPLKIRKKKKDLTNKLDQFEERMLRAVEDKVENRHISFIQGLLPTLQTFNETEVVEFQIGVLDLLQRIQKRKQVSHPLSAIVYDQNSQTPGSNISLPQTYSVATYSNNINHEYYTHSPPFNFHNVPRNSTPQRYNPHSSPSDPTSPLSLSSDISSL